MEYKRRVFSTYLETGFYLTL